MGQAELKQVVNTTDIPTSSSWARQFPPNPSSCSGRVRWPRDREAKEQFDIVLSTRHRVLAVTDAAVLSTMVDGTISSCAWLDGPTGGASRTLTAPCRPRTVLGVVMNDVDLRRSSYYGGYGYAYYAYYVARPTATGTGNAVNGPAATDQGLDIIDVDHVDVMSVMALLPRSRTPRSGGR